MQRILVTGANSFVGQNLISHLETFGFEILGLARSRKSKSVHDLANLSPITNRPYILGDLSDSLFIESISFKPDAIIHLAANRNSNEGISKLLQDNYLSTKNLQVYAQKNDCTRFIYTSSVSVHGQLSHSPLTENSGYENPNLYGLTKRLGELFLQDNNVNTNLYVLRLPAVLGLGAMDHWVSRILKEALSNSIITQRNADSLFNNILDVDDLSMFIIKLLSDSQQGSHTFPLASSEPITISEVINLVIQLTGSKSKIQKLDHGAPAIYIDDSYARQQFNFQSLTTVFALQKYVRTNAFVL